MWQGTETRRVAGLKLSNDYGYYELLEWEQGQKDYVSVAGSRNSM